MNTFLIFYILIGCLFIIIIKFAMDFKETENIKNNLDFNDPKVQLFFVVICIVLWPFIIILVFTEKDEK